MKPAVLILYNQPLLPKDHPDAAQEYAVLETADLVARTLDAAGYPARKFGLAREPAALLEELSRGACDVVFNLFEGHLDNPETESYVAALLEWSQVPYTGSSFAAMTLARAKHTSKHLFRGAGLPTAEFQVVQALPAAECTIAFPVIVKPATQDASLGIEQASVCTTREQLQARVAQMLEAYGPPVLIEQYISGREFNVSVLELPELKALWPIEVKLPVEGPDAWAILTYADKWCTHGGEYVSHIATDLPSAVITDMQRLALSAYRLVGCRQYARVDFRLSPDGKSYLLEVNPNPDISADADLTSCLGQAPMTYAQFIVRLVEQAVTSVII